MGRLLLSLVAGLAGAAAVHILVIFLLPFWSERDAWSLMEARADLFEIVALNEPGADTPPLSSADPLLREVGCRFDITDAPVRIAAPGGVEFWSMSVYDRRGGNSFSINDKTADATVDIVLATPFQALELRKDQPADLSASIIVELPSTRGIAVLRAFQPDWTYAAEVDAFLEETSCRPL